MERGIVVLAGVYLAVMAVMDVRKREIPVWPGVLCALCIILMQFVRGAGWMMWLPGIGIGLMLWIASKLSHGAIGEGDALVYGVMGMAIGFFHNLEVLVLSLALAAVFGAGLMVCRRVSWKHSMAFLPFTAVAYGMVVCL